MATARGARLALRAAVEHRGRRRSSRTTGDGMLASFDQTRGGAHGGPRCPARAGRPPVAGDSTPAGADGGSFGSANTRDGRFLLARPEPRCSLLAIGHGGRCWCRGRPPVLPPRSAPTSEMIGSRRASAARPRPAGAHLPAVRAGPCRAASSRRCVPRRTTRRTAAPGPLVRGVARGAARTWVRLLVHEPPGHPGGKVGGTGKTRLAVQAPGMPLDGYRDGVWLVELAALIDPDLWSPRDRPRAAGSATAPDSAPMRHDRRDYLRSRSACCSSILRAPHRHRRRRDGPPPRAAAPF